MMSGGCKSLLFVLVAVVVVLPKVSLMSLFQILVGVASAAVVTLPASRCFLL